MPRSRFIEFLLLSGVLIAFLDETVRKVLPGQPIYVTAVKDVFFLLAGLLVLLRYPQTHRHLLLMVPWALYAMLSGLVVAMRLESYLLPPAVLRTYAAAPLLLACGLYLGAVPAALRRVTVLFGVGAVAAIGLEMLQEVARESLPALFSQRIYIEKHSLAGGRFNESLFASPQTLAQVLIVLLAVALTAMVTTNHLSRFLRFAILAAVTVVAVYLTRIRMGMLVAGWVAAVTLLLVPKGGVSLGRVFGRTVIVALVLLALGSLLLIVADDPYRTRDLRRDQSFFLQLLNPSELADRALLFVRESRDLPGHSAAFGFGAGTGGMMRGVVGEMKLLAVPRIYDTGSALIYHEMGLLGAALFLLGYLGTLLRAGLRALVWPALPPEAAPALAVASGFLAWFLLKSHTIIANGLSHVLWMTCLGVAVAAVERARQPVPQQEYQYDPDYAMAQSPYYA